MTSALVPLALVAGLMQPLIEPAYGALAATRLDWGTKPSMPTDRTGLELAAAPNGKLYAVGGANTSGATPLTSVEQFTVPPTGSAAGAWAGPGGIAQLPAERHFPGLVAANGNLLVIGGVNGSLTIQHTIFEYDPVANTWTGQPNQPALAPMPTARAGHAVAIVSTSLYAIGGTTTGPDALSLVERAVITQVP